MNEPNITEGYTETKFHLYRSETESGWQFQWKREDGVSVSPMFSSLACAWLYPQRMPMLSDAEFPEYFTEELKLDEVRLFPGCPP